MAATRFHQPYCHGHEKSVENETLMFILTRRMAKNVTIGKTLGQVHYYRKGAPGEKHELRKIQARMITARGLPTRFNHTQANGGQLEFGKMLLSPRKPNKNHLSLPQ